MTVWQTAVSTWPAGHLLNENEAVLLRRYRGRSLSRPGFPIAARSVRKVYAVVKHPLKEQFGLDDIQIAYPWTIYLITYMLGQFFAAWLGRHVESRRVLAWA